MRNLERLFEAVANNQKEFIDRILTSDPKLIELPDDEGVVAAFVAAQYGHTDLVKYLMEYTRVSMNVWDKNHRNILHYAAKSNKKDLFAYLVERINMDPLDVDINSNTPLDVAIGHVANEIIDYYTIVLGITAEDLYKNPVVPGTFPDPSVIRVGEDYYMVNSSFMYFPCIPVLHSKDLVNWQIIGHAITDTTYINLDEIGNGRGFWAPDISYYDGRFYITATYRMNDHAPVLRKQQVVHSTLPEGPYSKPTYIEEDGIDPSLFTDQDGARYMLLNRGARIFEISSDGSKQLSKAEMLWYGHQKRAPEAPHLLYKDGYYYVFVSEGGTGRGHRISVARSKTLKGNYINSPYNPILIQDDPNHPIQRSGHGKLVDTPSGDWYIMYLCGRMIDQKWSILGRETGLDPVTWTEEGWPIVNELKGPSGANLKPKLTTHKPQIKNQHKGIKNLSCHWHFVRMPKLEHLKVTKDQVIAMRPGQYDLDHFLARNVLLVRQTDFKCCVEVTIEIEHLTDGTEAGLIGYYDTDTYQKFHLVRKENELKLLLVERIDEQVIETQSITINETSALRIGMEIDYLKRSYYYYIDGVKHIYCVKEDVYYLCDEGISKGKRFTGAMIGLFTRANNPSNDLWVHFSQYKLSKKEENDEYNFGW